MLPCMGVLIWGGDKINVDYVGHSLGVLAVILRACNWLAKAVFRALLMSRCR